VIEAHTLFGFVYYLDKVSNDRKVRVVSKRNNLLMNHKSKDSHHSSTAVVKLNSTLGKLGLFIKGIPSEVKSSVTEVTNEFTFSGNILHNSNLKETNEGEDLEKSLIWDGLKSSPSVRDGAE